MIRVKEWTGDETISVKDIVAKLNEMHKLDPELMQKLSTTFYHCNNDIRDHETVQAKCYDGKDVEDPASMENPKVGFIGALNGLLGIDRKGAGPIAYIEDKGTIVGFKMTDTAAFDKRE